MTSLHCARFLSALATTTALFAQGQFHHLPKVHLPAVSGSIAALLWLGAASVGCWHAAHREPRRVLRLPVPPPMAIDGRTREPGDPFVGQFLASMVIDYEKWHDGIGYAVDSLVAASPAQRTAIESMLLARGISDWRDVEALAVLDTPRAREALVKLHALGSTELRLAVERHAPDLVGGDERTRSMVQAIASADLGNGLSQALDAAAEFHPPAVIDALFAAALARDGQTACLAAGMLWHVHGHSDETFDWDQRPLFLRFNTDDHAERIAAFRELCGLLGVDPQPYLART